MEVLKKHKLHRPDISSAFSKCLKVMTVNDLKRIGFIGRVLECFIGTFSWVFFFISILQLFSDKKSFTRETWYTHIWFCHIFFFYHHFSHRYLPRSVGMRRIALHKSISAKGDKMYLLVCECSDLLTEISSAAVLIPTIRARLCGYTGLYRPIQVF